MNKIIQDYENGIKLLEAYNKGLLEKIVQLEAAQPKWISVEERLPEGFATVILYGDVRGITVGFYDVVDRYFWRSEGNCTLRSVNATHWMPLPPEPEVK